MEKALPNGWKVIDGHHLFKAYKFDDFKSALAFVNRVGAEAELLNHHPNISFTWGKVDISIWTHTENGVTAKDYELAERINKI